tara:strand:- start:2745 stop:3188 length:444 start_codon:yes stop_codon:yes gene_type:complete
MKLLQFKKIIFSNLMFLFFAFLNAQTDVILKIDGEEMKGKVQKINDADIDFIYENETLVYQINKAEIKKITFASGRIQFFNKEEKHNVNLESHHNKVAVLPFGYIKDKETSNELMTNKIQQETYTIFKKKSCCFKIPRSTNYKCFVS